MKERISAQQSLVAELALRERELYRLFDEAEKPMKAARDTWYPVFQELNEAKAKLAAMQEIEKEMKGETVCQK